MSEQNPTGENSYDALSNMILTHWKNHHPKMLEQFRQENRLEEELEKTAEQFNDLMYELTVEKKMGYQEAKEIAVNQFLLPEEPEEESTSTNPSQS